MKFTLLIIWLILAVVAIIYFIWAGVTGKETEHILYAIIAMFMSVMTATALAEDDHPKF